MNVEEFKERNQEIYETWVSGIVASIIGIGAIWYSFNVDAKFIGRLILFLFGVFLQIPLGYFKIYKLLFG